MYKRSFLTAIVLFLLSAVGSAQTTWIGKVVGISDGDTIKVLKNQEQVKIRLYGIDCPEKKQAFGTKAKKFTANMIFEKVVEIRTVGQGRYGRTLAWFISMENP